MDVHLRRCVHGDGVHPVVPELPPVVLLRPHHDHLHCVVHDHRLAHPRPGAGSAARRACLQGSVFHGRHEHPLHFRKPCRHSGDYARDVQASEVQVHLPPGDAVCVHVDDPVCHSRLLGVRRRLAHKRQFARVAASRCCAGCRSGAHAHPPVHHGGVRGDAPLLHVGEADRRAPHEEPAVPGAVQSSGDAPHLVLRHRLPVLRPHQLHCRRAAGHVHRVHHPLHGSYSVLPHCRCSSEFCGEAAVLSPQLDGRVHGEHSAVCVHCGGWRRVRGMGERHQLHQTGRDLRRVCEMLSVSEDETLVSYVHVDDFAKLGS